MVYKFCDTKTFVGAATLARSETLTMQSKSAVKNENMASQELAEELHKKIIRKIRKRKVHSLFIDNIRGADLNINIFSNYARVNYLKDKKGFSITNAFQKF